ncbi:MAG TPA: amidase family protein [Stellaceae bacterium]|nr:amidase family protein [Stellaceae bacterium]
MTELWRLGAAELAALVRARKVSAREAAESALARLDAVNPRVNAVVAHRPELVRQQADAIDARIARGEDPGPLAGVPVTTKINVDHAGFATSNGTRLQRDLVAEASSPVVDNLARAGAVLLGRTNAPAFALRWFTDNLLHGATRNPRDPSLTPGGSSGGAAAGVAVGIGALAHGTDIGGSIRYPAYACGVHGLRPSLGRVPAFNASGPERGIGPQLMAVSGPIARTIADLRLGLAAMAARDLRDPWWVPAPLEGPPAPRRAALCLRPDGLVIVPEVERALKDAARRLGDAGWTVEEVADTPPLREASELQARLWLGDNFPALADLVAREGDPGALAVIEAFRGIAVRLEPDVVARSLARRNTLVRQWLLFLEQHPVLLLPLSGELPFPDGLDLQGAAGFERVWRAQLTQTGLPTLGVPALAVATGLAGTAPVGVQVVAGRYREDLCLAAGAAIEAGGMPAAPVDPVA